MERNKHLIATRDRTGEPAIIEELMKGYQRPEDLASAGVIIEQFRRKLLPAVRAGSNSPDVSAGDRRLTVNALHKCSHVPVEFFHGLHKGHVPTMIVIDARDMRNMTSNIVRVGG
jgi:hypothetical protein